MRFIKYASVIAAIAIIMASCEDNASEVGSSLVTDESEVVVDSLFTLSGNSVPNEALLSRTTLQLLGLIDAKEYGRFDAGFVTQFMPAQNMDTAGVSVNDIDSVKLALFINSGGFTGDSIVPMGLSVFKLNRQLPSGLTSEFDPQGYYDPQDVWAERMYSANALHNDSLAKLNYRTIEVKLPRSFGQSLYSEYKSNPATFATPQAFAQFFPGIYVKSTFGSGRVMNIVDSRINLYYSRHEKVGSGAQQRDTVYHFTRTYLAVTPEVITDNIIRYDMSVNLQTMVDNGLAMLVAPAGMDVQIDFPAREIIDAYKKKGMGIAVLNTLSLNIPVSVVSNKYGIEPPANVLIVLSKDKDSFFLNSKINDDKTSFLASYNEKTRSYGISDMRDYILSLVNKPVITDDDCTFTITPVDVVTESSSDYYYGSQVYITGINPYISKPAMAQLLLDKAKIKLTFSKQSINY